MEAEDNETHTFRPYTTTDIPFVQNSWGSSYYKGSSYHTVLTPDEFHAFHKITRDSFFHRPQAAVILCVSKEDPDLIMGWIAVEKPVKSPGIVIHYVYVKQAFKGLGMASALLEKVCGDGPVLFTHLTERANRMMIRNPDKFQDFFYAPHLC